MTNTLSIENQLAIATAEIAHLKAQMGLQRSFIVGADQHAEGKFFGFGGQGSMRRDFLLSVIAKAELPSDIAPGVKSAHAQAGEAVTRLNSRGYVVRSDKARAQRDANGVEIPRTWRARWIIGQQIAGGFTTCGYVMLVESGEGDEKTGKLEFSADLPASIAAGIRADFEALVADRMYDATDISTWLRGRFAHDFKGVLVGANWYVRAKHVDDAERLCMALSATWGRNWLLPAVPMIASDELASGIVASFVADAAAMFDDFACRRDDEEVKMQRATATKFLARVRELMERAAGFSAMFGDSRTATVKARLVAIANEIQASTSDVFTSNAKLFDAAAK